jgi:2-dehydropantoate 2-reductase
MKSGIYGAGSLGIVLGAYIARAGIPIDLFHRNAEHVQALREHGARVTGTVDFSAPVQAFTPQEMQGCYDVLFLATKQLYNQETVSFLKPYLAEDGVICTLQNGFPEPAITEIVGESRVLGCVVEWGATLLEPGVSALTSKPDSLAFGLGSLSEKKITRLEQVKEILETMCPVKVEENFLGVRWSKLLINSAFSGMSAVLGATFGAAVDDKRARRCIQRVIKECIDVARAKGVVFAPVQGMDIVKQLDFQDPIKKQIALMIIPLAIYKHRLLKASMLQDLEKNKKTEVDFINGLVAQYGRQAGVPTPYNDKIIEIIHSIEDGERKPQMANVDLFSI